MNDRRLYRANSFIRARKERADKLLKKKHVTELQRCANKPGRVSSFLTIPNAFRQCTVTLPIIHSAIPRLLREKRMSVNVVAPLPGVIIEVLVSIGDSVKENDELLILEAMKMENPICAPEDGSVKEINVQPDDRVETNQLMVVLE